MAGVHVISCLGDSQECDELDSNDSSPSIGFTILRNWIFNRACSDWWFCGKRGYLDDWISNITSNLWWRKVIIRYSTDMESKGTFFTDSNGREMQQRNLNYRPTWDLNVTHPISGRSYLLSSSLIQFLSPSLPLFFFPSPHFDLLQEIITLWRLDHFSLIRHVKSV